MYAISSAMRDELSRRAFVAGTAAVAAAAAVLAISSATALADEGEAIECDIIVVGTGPSGGSAAMEAADQGAKVVVIERKEAMGGSAFGTEGIFGLGSTMQAEAGVELPANYQVLQEELDFTNYRIDPLFWKDMLSHSGQDIDWLLAHGVPLERVDNYNGVGSFECFHWWPGGSGTDFGPAVQAYLSTKENVTVFTSCAVTDLIVEDGAVVGVHATQADGTAITVKAPATVMCTGGFCDNFDLLNELSDINFTYASSVGVGADGAGHLMMREIGAATMPVSALQDVYVYGYTLGDPISQATGYQGAMIVNQNGERFMAEDTVGTKLCALAINALNSQESNFAILDSDRVDHLELEEFDFTFGPFKAGAPMPGIRAQLEEAAQNGNGNVFRADTIEELCEVTGMDPAIFQATVEQYNGFCEKGLDEDFGTGTLALRPLATPPFYAARQDPTVFASIGGTRTNRSNQVIDGEGQVIPGLYCGGIEGCMLYRETYNFALSGGMNAYNVYSGRNAALHALGVDWA